MLGLCVGASLMTFFEVFDLIINLVYILFDRKLKVNKVKDVLADDKCNDEERIMFLETELKLSLKKIKTLELDMTILKNHITLVSSVD